MKSLEFGEYSLPEDCVVKRVGGTIVLRQSRKIKVQEYRCKECKYFGVGSSTKATHWKTYVCHLKPKCEYKGEQIYYATRAYGKICDKFELNKNN